MPDELMVSYAQNAEDVVLWRALGRLHDGVYIDVGGFDPDEDSVTRVFYEHGWRGIDIEPVPGLAERFRHRRPRNEVVAAAITDQDVDEVVLHWFDSTGLSTLDDRFAERNEQAGFDHQTIRVPARRLDDVLTASAVLGSAIHFLKIDVEGAEDQVLRSVDLTRWRPWVLVIEATEPNSTTPVHQGWEPLVLAAGYTFTLFDGLSRFYVSEDHPELIPALSYPACVLDGYTTARQAELERRAIEMSVDVDRHNQAEQEARATALHWRNSAAVYWAESVARAQASETEARQARRAAERLSRQYQGVRQTLQRVRTERDRLRENAKGMRRRIDRMTRRVERLRTELDRLRPRDDTLVLRARRGLGRARARFTDA